METEIKKRPIKLDDGQDIIELHNFMHPHNKRDMSWWEWEFLNNPYGKLFGFGAEVNGKLVAQSALLPLWLKINEEKVLCSQNVDVMTHPDHRKKGIFTSLALLSYDHVSTKNMKLVYGFPNTISHPILINRLGWTKLGRLPCLIKFLNRKFLIQYELKNIPYLINKLHPRILVQKREVEKIINGITKRFTGLKSKSQKSEKKPEAKKNIKVQWITEFDNRFDELWKNVKSEFPICIWKDSEYLNWRYIHSTIEKYMVVSVEEDKILAGFMVIKCDKKQKNLGYIIDTMILPGRDHIASILISECINYFEKQNIDMIMCHIFDHSPYYQYFKAHGFIEFGLGNNFNVRITIPDEISNLAKFRKNWHLMEGDIDTY